MKKIDVGTLLGAMVDEIKARSQMAMIYLAVMVPLTALSLYYQNASVNAGSQLNFGFRIDEALMAQGALAVVVVTAAFVIGLLAHYWLLAGMVRQNTAPAFDRFLPYVGIYILATLGLILGLILLIIPGIILAIRWSPLLPAVIDRSEHAIDAFGDSWAMTDGHSWTILGAAILLFLAVLIPGGALTTFANYTFGAGSIMASFFQSLVDQAMTLFAAGFAVGAYRLLREDSEQIAEVFE